MDKETFLKKKAEEEDKEQLDANSLLQMNFAEKLNMVKELADSIIFDTEKKYRKVKDLLIFTEDPKDVDVVLKAVQQLCRVFLEIIPAYRIREDMQGGNQVDDETGAKKGMKLSKEVAQLRDYESFLI